MNRQWQGAAIALAFVAAFVLCILMHSLVGAVTVLLTAVTVSFVIGIAWMRTSSSRGKDKPRSVP